MGIGKFKTQSEKRKVKSQSLKFLVLSFSFSLLALSFTLNCFAADKTGLVSEGNKLYNNGKLDEALKNYNQALAQAPDEPLINFNIGNGLYKKKQYKEAIAAYEKALLLSGKKIEAKVNYNIGNCKFRDGKSKEIFDLMAAIIEYRSSLDYYKRSMELDPDDKEAKFNHEFVEKLLKSLIDKAKQQQKQEQKDQKLGENQKDRQKPEGQQKKDEQQQQKQEQAQQAKTEQQQQKEQSQQKQEYSTGQLAQQTAKLAGGDMMQQGKEQDKDMSKEEAGVLLNDFRQQEQQERQLNDKHTAQKYPNVEKDW